jgi:hypothetical protein
MASLAWYAVMVHSFVSCGSLSAARAAVLYVEQFTEWIWEAEDNCIPYPISRTRWLFRLLLRDYLSELN